MQWLLPCHFLSSLNGKKKATTFIVRFQTSTRIPPSYPGRAGRFEHPAPRAPDPQPLATVPEWGSIDDGNGGRRAGVDS